METSTLQSYETSATKLRQALSSLTEADLHTQPQPAWNSGSWTIQQVVLHIVDTDLVLTDRMKRVIAEDNPTLLAFDEQKWTAALLYEHQSAANALEMLDLNHRQMSAIFHHLPPSAFERFGTHNTAGKKTLADLIAFAVTHMDHHVKFIHAKRIKMGKEMW
ncbi:MAG: DinB family protein [Phycisphaerales bacterium]|jgi:uncharacterized damage-inducible protein DinB|nr:DinB family protein [Phycisphaerales bacterium]